MRVPRLNRGQEDKAARHEQDCINDGIDCREHLLRHEPVVTPAPPAPPAPPPPTDPAPLQASINRGTAEGKPLEPSEEDEDDIYVSEVDERADVRGQLAERDRKDLKVSKRSTDGVKAGTFGKAGNNGKAREVRHKSRTREPKCVRFSSIDGIEDKVGGDKDKNKEDSDDVDGDKEDSDDEDGDKEDEEEEDSDEEDGDDEDGDDDDGGNGPPTDDGHDDDLDGDEAGAVRDPILASPKGVKHRKVGRMSNALLEAAAQLREEVNVRICALGDQHKVDYDTVYRAMGCGDPAAGRSQNTWNLFSQIKRAEWKDIPDNLGKNFRAKAHAEYRKATAGLDSSGKVRFRMELLLKTKKLSQGESSARKSIMGAAKEMSKAVSAEISYYQYIILLPMEFSFSVLKTRRHHAVHAFGLVFSSSRHSDVRSKGMLVTMDPVILRLISIGKVDVSEMIGNWEDAVRSVYDY